MKRDDTASRKVPDWAIVLGIFVSTALFVKIFTPLGQPLPPFMQPHIKSAIYPWPRGCENKRYTILDDISENCALDQYRLKDYRAYGFPHHRGDGEYYRVGNDYLAMSCGFYKNCKVEEIVYDSFYQ
jgi:hypothetical protein